MQYITLSHQLEENSPVHFNLRKPKIVLIPRLQRRWVQQLYNNCRKSFWNPHRCSRSFHRRR